MSGTDLVMKELPSDPRAEVGAFYWTVLAPAQPTIHRCTRRRTACSPSTNQASAALSFKPTRRTHRARRSHLGLAGRLLRWARVGSRAEHDCIELAVELGEPRVLFLQLLGFALQLLDRFLLLQNPLLQRVSLHFLVDRWMPIERLQKPSPRRQRCKEFLLAAVGRRKRLPGGRHGHIQQRA